MSLTGYDSFVFCLIFFFLDFVSWDLKFLQNLLMGMKSLSLCQSIYYNSNIFHSISPNGFSAAITLHMPISTSILYINALHRNIAVFSCMLCIILYTHQQQTRCSTATKCIFVHLLFPRHSNNLMQLKIFWQCLLQSGFPPPRYLKLWKISWKCPRFFLYVYHFQRLKMKMYFNI